MSARFHTLKTYFVDFGSIKQIATQSTSYSCWEVVYIVQRNSPQDYRIRFFTATFLVSQMQATFSIIKLLKNLKQLHLPWISHELF